MIVKKVKNENSKPKAWQIGDLLDYIRHPHNRNPQEKIEYAGGRNFISETHNGQKLEMITIAKESAHSNMPVTHWIFSWREGEHPHRAPGFQNQKPKHRREDGGFPQVRLIFAERRQCAKALELAHHIDREYADAVKAQRERPRAVSSGRTGDPVSAYYAHLENIRKHLTIEDYSRVDAMIALRMRSNGHSRLDVADAVRQCAPTIRETQTCRNWQRYAERTADYAFGMAGDVDMARNERYREMWRRIESIGEQSQSRMRMR